RHAGRHGGHPPARERRGAAAPGRGGGGGGGGGRRRAARPSPAPGGGRPPGPRPPRGRPPGGGRGGRGGRRGGRGRAGPGAPPPVVIAGFGPKMAELAGRVADGINTPGGPGLPARLAVARRAREDAGRDPSTFLVTASARPAAR